MCSSAYVIKKGRWRYELTLIHLIISFLIQCHKKNILLSITLIYFRAHIYSLELHHSNECFYLMKTPFTRISLSRCPWYIRIKRHSTNDISSTILIYFLAQTCSYLTFRIHVDLICVIPSWRKVDLLLICKCLLHWYILVFENWLLTEALSILAFWLSFFMLLLT